MNRVRVVTIILIILLGIVLSSTTNLYAKETVVIYTSVDQIFSEPVLKAFEAQTGIRVKAIYDVEASKTVGLVKRLMAEKSNPVADLFWNSEYLRTFQLKQLGVLGVYAQANAGDIPVNYRSKTGHWAGFGIRARVFVVNTDMVLPEDMPSNIEDLTDPRWKGKAAIAKPYFGTTSTHFAALYVKWGREKFVRFLKDLKKNDVAVLPGNSNVRDAVVQGRYAFGLTDTDDVNVALEQKRPVKMIYMNQDTDGSFAVFQTVARISNGPNPETAQRLFDYLTSLEVEQALIHSGAVQISVRPQAGNNENPKLWHTVSDDLLQAIKPCNQLVREYLF